jgi:hypothetical protein
MEIEALTRNGEMREREREREREGEPSIKPSPRKIKKTRARIYRFDNGKVIQICT